MNSIGIISDPGFQLHLTGFGHVESPERQQVIIDRLEQKGLLSGKNWVHPQEASLNELQLAHSEDYIRLVENECAALGDNEIKPLSTGDVQISKNSFKIAKFAAGSVLKAVDEVFSKRFSSVFCVVRPPGHHASRSIGMGFCLFNNIAVGAFYALKMYPIRRVLIADFDLHHGNGTEDLVKNHPGIFYFSTHQRGIWPQTGSEDEHGAYNNVLNCPVLGGQNSRDALLDIYAHTLPAAMEKFQPELVLISAGFDAHESDPLGQLKLTAEDFGTITGHIRTLAERYAEGRIVSVLEGGYNLDAIAESASYHVKSLR